MDPSPPAPTAPARRILLADDDRVGRRILERIFSARGYEVVVAEDGAEAWGILEADGAPRLAVLDWSMPGLDGVEVCRRVRSRAGLPYTYLLLLTARDGAAELVEAMDAGADDFLGKPVRVDELVARVRAGQRVLDLQAALLDAQERLRVLATRDALTGEPNRATVLAALEAELALARRDDTSVGVVLADIDRFKLVNDAHGHDAGDAVIRHAVARLRSALRPGDHLGRYGGEEILLVLPRCDEDELTALAERARRAVAEAVVLHGGSALSVTVSLGAVASRGRPGATAGGLITEADRALYRAKNGGRNRVALGTAPPPLALASGQ